MPKKKAAAARGKAWADAQRRHRLSPAQVRMARELGLNPKKLDKIDNHGQEPWKTPFRGSSRTCAPRRFSRTDTPNRDAG